MLGHQTRNRGSGIWDWLTPMHSGAAFCLLLLLYGFNIKCVIRTNSFTRFYLYTNQVLANLNVVEIRGVLEKPNLKLTYPLHQVKLLFWGNFNM